jgi:hypothetical protein
MFKLSKNIAKNQFIFQNLIHLENYKKICRKIRPKNFQRNKLLKILGFIQELGQNHSFALKIYLLFLKIISLRRKFCGKIFLICFWENIYQLQIKNFSKTLLKKDEIHFDLLLFNFKFSEKNGYDNNSVLFCNKIKKNCLIKKNIQINLNKFKVLYFNHQLRIYKKLSSKFSEKKFQYRILSKQILKHDIKLDIFFLTIQNYLSAKNKNSVKFKQMIFFSKYSKFDVTKKPPLIFRIWEKFWLENIKKKFYEQYFNFFIIFLPFYFKWILNIGNLLIKKKIQLFFFLVKNFISQNLYKNLKSFYPMARNLFFKKKFYFRIAKIFFLKGYFSEAFEILIFISKKKIYSYKFLNILIKLKEKIFQKKTSFKTYFKSLEIYIEKNFLLSKKKKLINQNSVDKFLENAEILFERNKMVILSRFIISNLILKNQKNLELYQFEKEIFLKAIFNLKKKTFIENYDFSKKNKNFARKKKTFTFFPSFYEKLIEKIFAFILNQKIFIKDQRLDFLISHKFFFKNFSDDIKIFFIFFSIKKKKFEKAYKMSRQECLLNPYSFRFWCILNKLENQIGIFTSKTLRYSLRILQKYPNSVPAIVFSGNHCSVFGSFGYSLAEYLQAYRWRKDSSSLNFLISIQYLNGSFSRKNNNPEFSIFLSLSFFLDYKKLRRFSSQFFLKRNIISNEFYIEIYYNTARFYLLLGFNYLALKNFKKGLRRLNFSLTINKINRICAPLIISTFKKEILLNISILYCISGNKIFQSGDFL